MSGHVSQANVVLTPEQRTRSAVRSVAGRVGQFRDTLYSVTSTRTLVPIHTLMSAATTGLRQQRLSGEAVHGPVCRNEGLQTSKSTRKYLSQNKDSVSDSVCGADSRPPTEEEPSPSTDSPGPALSQYRPVVSRSGEIPAARHIVNKPRRH